MQIFLDESGDCGMRDRRSADYFAVTAVCVDSADAVAACEHEIRRIRETQGLVEDYEFHFVRVKDRHRREFLRQIANCEFSFSACILDKSKLHGEHWLEKAFFYEKVLYVLVEGVAAW